MYLKGKGFATEPSLSKVFTPVSGKMDGMKAR